MMTKMVDGIEVICSAEEEASIKAEWAANDAAAAAVPVIQPLDPVAKMKEFLAANPDVMAVICK